MAQRATRGLEEYRRKRDFTRTPEPAGPDPRELDPSARVEEGGSFVIHKHAAQRLHYDLRLEMDGVLRSWAVPKGPGLVPGEKRLAVHVEDHPLEYGNFEGIIPEREYGGGTVMLWDRGRWAPVKSKGRQKASDDRIDFVLVGEKLRGTWTLVRTTRRPGEKADNWLLIKRHNSEEVVSQVTDLSVVTGRTMAQIADDRDRAWTGAGEIETESTPAPPPSPRKLKGARRKASPQVPKAALAQLVDEAPKGDDWLHEIKFDGYRILARCQQGQVELVSRNGKDWTQRFPEIAQLLGNLPVEQAILDGEVVALASDGTSSFRRLQEALASGDSRGLVYQLFDLVYLDGYDLAAVPLTDRKQVLHDLLASAGFASSALIRYTDHILGQGPVFFDQACRLGLEGIISKRADGAYRAGQRKNWFKIKCTAHEELVICGYTDPGGSRKGFGSLLLAAWHDGNLIFAGRVGTGFNAQLLNSLYAQLRKLEIDSPPVSNPPDEKGLHWVKPELVGEVEFTEWTRDGVLRHPAFRGLREDRTPDEIQLPAAAAGALGNTSAPVSRFPAKRRVTTRKTKDTAEVAGVTLTHANKVLYPEQGITKLQLAQYYEAIAPWMLPQIAYRPLSLVRCPEGYTGECFFQKHPRSTITQTVPRVQIDERKERAPYLYIETLPHVVALVQTGALELHTWGSRVDDVEHPDTLVFDLDPADDVPLAETQRVARELRARLADLGLASFPRTTGGKGVHLVVPIEPTRDWEVVKRFCHVIAQQHAQDDRARVTSTMAKSRRRGKIFIDYLRNGRGATAIASFSTRARRDAPVAVPVAWEELTEALRPDRFTVSNLRRRLSHLDADPWGDFDSARAELSEELLTAVGIAQDR